MLRLPTENTSDREEKTMVDWIEKSLGEIAEVTKLAGFEFTKYIKYNDDGEIIALRALNLRNGELDLSDIKRISREVSEGLTRSKIYKDDILLTYTGNGYGDCAIIEENDKYHLAPNICKIVPNQNVIYPYYLYCYIRSKAFYNQMSNNMTGSGQPTIPMKTIRLLKIPVPDMSVQVKIANMIWSLNQKIRNNKVINNNLEQQTQAIFKSWFVDFELNYGIMPSYWKVSQLGSIAKISTEVFSPAKNPNVEVEHYSIPAYDEKRYPVFETSNGIKSNKYRLSSNSVMISKLNPDTKRIWRPYCISDNPICSTEFIVYEPINPLNRDFIYSIIDSIGFSAFLCSHTTGSTNSRQRATPSITLTYDIIVPDEKTIQAFCSIVSPMYDTIENNIKENQKLAETRDKLLPKLMSGELDVSGIDL